MDKRKIQKRINLMKEKFAEQTERRKQDIMELDEIFRNTIDEIQCNAEQLMTMTKAARYELAVKEVIQNSEMDDDDNDNDGDISSLF